MSGRHLGMEKCYNISARESHTERHNSLSSPNPVNGKTPCLSNPAFLVEKTNHLTYPMVNYASLNIEMMERAPI